MPRLSTIISICLALLAFAAPASRPAAQANPPFEGTLIYTAPDGNLVALSGAAVQPRALTSDGAVGRSNRSPQVSPDGAWLAYLQVEVTSPGLTGTLFLSNLATFETQPLAEAVRRFAWAPDQADLDTQLAFVDGEDELFRVDPADPIPQPLTDAVLEFAWLPGSRQIAFTITDAKACTPQDNPRGGGVWIFDLDQFLVSELFNLEPTGSRLVHLGVSPDGRWFSVCNGGCATGCMPSLWDRETQESRPATILGWSPDGRFYLTAAVSTFEIAPAPLLAIDTQDEKQVTLYEEENHAPLAAAWSPDGKWVALQSAELAAGASYSPASVLLVSADGLDRRPLGEPNHGIASWSPDSQALLLHSLPPKDAGQPEPVTAQRYDLDGEAIGPAFEIAYPVQLHWSDAALDLEMLPSAAAQETPAVVPSATAASTPTTPPATTTPEPVEAEATPALQFTPAAGPTAGSGGWLQMLPLRSGVLLYGCSLGGLLLLILLGVVVLRRRTARRNVPDFAPLSSDEPAEELPDDAYPTVSWSHSLPADTPAAHPPEERLTPAPEPAPRPFSASEPALRRAAPSPTQAQHPQEPPAAVPAASQVSAWLEQGMSQARAGQYPAAFQTLRRVVQADPQNGPAWMGLGFVLMQQNDLANAEQCFRRAQVQGHPDAARALAQLAQRRSSQS